MGQTKRRIILDISTQRDLFLPDGKCCVANHRDILANIRRVVAYARRNGMPLLSLAEVYHNNNGCSEPYYCLDGTQGQKKIPYTLLNNRISFPADSTRSLPFDLFSDYRQVILHQRTTNPFDEPQIERLLSEIPVDEFIIIGCCAEESVKAAGLGLLQRGREVTVVTDAVGFHSDKEAKLSFRKIKAKGGWLTTTAKIAGKSHLRSIGLCRCTVCSK
jgi:nicotinamidase-related amidase